MYNRRRRRCRLSLFVNVLFARRICSRVAGLPVVCYSFAFDSAADAGAGRCDVALPADIQLLPTSRLKFYCFLLRRRAGPCDVIFIFYMLIPRRSCVARRIPRLLLLHFTNTTRCTYSRSRAAPRVAPLSFFSCVVSPLSPLLVEESVAEYYVPPPRYSSVVDIQDS